MKQLKDPRELKEEKDIKDFVVKLEPKHEN